MFDLTILFIIAMGVTSLTLTFLDYTLLSKKRTKVETLLEEQAASVNLTKEAKRVSEVEQNMHSTIIVSCQTGNLNPLLRRLHSTLAKQLIDSLSDHDFLTFNQEEYGDVNEPE